MERKNIRLYIVPFIAVAVFSVLLFAAGYAYFSATTTMNTANYQVNLPVQTSLVCTKTDCNATITPDMMTNTNINSNTAKVTSNCSLSCTCSGTQGAVCSYDVKLLESGITYTPSSGLGSNKEFTAKVTSGSGCATQNSAGTETQINTLKNKIVSSCLLTVPQGGSITSNVYAEFKWYNLNLDQSVHANKVYNYQLTNEDGNGSEEEVDTPYNSQTQTGTIYREDETEIRNGDNISILGNNYVDSVNNIHSYDPNYHTKFFLKHNVNNGIITSSYSCVQYGGVTACLKGADPSKYGTYDGISSTKVSNVTGATKI